MSFNLVNLYQEAYDIRSDNTDKESCFHHHFLLSVPSATELLIRYSELCTQFFRAQRDACTSTHYQNLVFFHCRSVREPLFIPQFVSRVQGDLTEKFGIVSDFSGCMVAFFDKNDSFVLLRNI